MAKYIVKTIVAVLPLRAGSERYFYRNAVVSDETITEDGIAHGLTAGLISEVVEEAPPLESEVTPAPTTRFASDEAPSDKWNVAQLDAYALEHSIDVTTASNKAEKLGLILAANPANPA